uniref:Cyclin B n=1 Tax=Leptobrachium leishanense TaxID=445787 RepID=A0A8C5M3G6_9ANUR
MPENDMGDRAAAKQTRRLKITRNVPNRRFLSKVTEDRADVKPPRGINNAIYHNHQRPFISKVIKTPQLEHGSTRKVESPIVRRDRPASKVWIQDYDSDDYGAHITSMCSEYMMEIYSHLKQLEAEQVIQYHYLQSQNITPHLRSITVNWLVRIHFHLQLTQESLFTGVRILDRFLQAKHQEKHSLPLAALASLFIACKYEEPIKVQIAAFLSATNHCFPAEKIREMELHILVTLEFRVGTVTSLEFLKRASRLIEMDSFSCCYAQYLSELALADYDMVHMAPSKIATAACYLTRLAIEGENWNPRLQYYMGHSEEDVLAALQHLAKNLISSDEKPATERVTYSKYDSDHFDNLSSMPLLYVTQVYDLAEKAEAGQHF